LETRTHYGGVAADQDERAVRGLAHGADRAGERAWIACHGFDREPVHGQVNAHVIHFERFGGGDLGFDHIER
jgi:hypothetical protein